MNNKYIVRLWDMFDGWIDVTGPISKLDAELKWNELTCNGSRYSEYKHGDYYSIFSANSSMIMTPDFFGR